MAEHDDREEASRRYRGLPREEPPEALDAAIRAHARRAVELHPAPLVPPTGRREWYFPLAAAAILVLAVAVTWHVEREQPDMVAVAPAETQPEAAKPIPESQTEPARKDATGARRKVEKAPQRDNAVLAKEQPARDQAVTQPQPQPQQEAKAAAAPAPAARSEAMERRAFSETPEQWLDRIAKLRAEGRHEEADRALAEFRKRHPDFRIAPEMLEKVEKK